MTARWTSRFCLRRKIETDPSNPVLLTTERGAGYTFTAAVSVIR
jgi:DNA-binding response OmpR family regulator